MQQHTAHAPAAVTQQYTSEVDAKNAADVSLEQSCTVAVVLQHPQGNFAWIAGLPKNGGWVVAVRTFEGEWVDFDRSDHAIEFARVEDAIARSRDHLLDTLDLALGGHQSERRARTLPSVAYLCQAIDTLRREREELYPL